MWSQEVQLTTERWLCTPGRSGLRLHNWNLRENSPPGWEKGQKRSSLQFKFTVLVTRLKKEGGNVWRIINQKSQIGIENTKDEGWTLENLHLCTSTAKLTHLFFFISSPWNRSKAVTNRRKGKVLLRGTDVGVRTHSAQTHTHNKEEVRWRNNDQRLSKGKGVWGEGRASDRGAQEDNGQKMVE